MTAVAAAPIRLGVVSFLNAVPLIDGLEGLEGVSLEPSVPSRLMGRIEQGAVDLALASSIDYQRSAQELRILPVGALGSDGVTMTVRLWSRDPLDRIECVHCDVDSHTSVALLRIILRRVHGIDCRVVPFDATAANGDPSTWPSSVLLIGDKVVTGRPPGDSHGHELDLGEAWQEMEGLPFIFGAWMGRADLDPDIAMRARVILDRQLRLNRQRLDEVVSRAAPARGWEPSVAASYLREHIRYEFGERERAGLEAFHAAAVDLGLIDECRPLRFFED